jgi:hypothetical protein
MKTFNAKDWQGRGIALICVLFCLIPPSVAHSEWISEPESARGVTDYYVATVRPSCTDEGGVFDNGFHCLRLSISNLTKAPIFVVWEKTFFMRWGTSDGLFYTSRDELAKGNNENNLGPEFNPRPDDVVLPQSGFGRNLYPITLIRKNICILDWANFDKCGRHPGRISEGRTGIFLTLRVMSLLQPSEVSVTVTTVITRK